MINSPLSLNIEPHSPIASKSTKSIQRKTLKSFRPSYKPPSPNSLSLSFEPLSLSPDTYSSPLPGSPSGINYNFSIDNLISAPFFRNVQDLIDLYCKNKCNPIISKTINDIFKKVKKSAENLIKQTNNDFVKQPKDNSRPIYIDNELFTPRRVVYIKQNGDSFIKRTVYNEPIDLFLSILEISYQKYAYYTYKSPKIQNKCSGFKVPKIINQTINKVNIDEDIQYVIDIEMELLRIIPVKDIKAKLLNESEDWPSKIKEALECLRQHGIYHNDSHPENIVFTGSAKNPKLTIIDFGKSSYDDYEHSNTGFPTEDITQDSFNNWLNGEDNFGDKYGGITPFRIEDAQRQLSNSFISAPRGGILNEKWCKKKQKTKKSNKPQKRKTSRA
jgi:hypothetical protein